MVKVCIKAHKSITIPRNINYLWLVILYYIYIVLLLLLSDLGKSTWVIVEALLLVEKITFIYII